MFRRQGIDLEWVLYSDYDIMVDAFVKGEIDLAWNGPLSYVKIKRQTNDNVRVIAMRDVDINFITHFITGANSGIGFAIPVNTVKRIVHELIAYGRVQTPILGITNIPQPDYYRQLWNIEGVIVLDVVDGTDPQRLGMRGLSRSRRGRIQLGDVIIEIDGQAVANEDDYANIMEQHRAGDVVRVKTRRDNGLVEYDIELQARSDR